MILELIILIILKTILFVKKTKNLNKPVTISDKLLPLLQQTVKFLWRCDGYRTCLVSAHISSSNASDRLHPSDHLTPPVQHTVVPTVCHGHDSPRYQFVLHDGQKFPRVLRISRPGHEYLQHTRNVSHPRQLTNSNEQGPLWQPNRRSVGEAVPHSTSWSITCHCSYIFWRSLV
jgi:hypothetical protein